MKNSKLTIKYIQAYCIIFVFCIVIFISIKFIKIEYFSNLAIPVMNKNANQQYTEIDQGKYEINKVTVMKDTYIFKKNKEDESFIIIGKIDSDMVLGVSEKVGNYLKIIYSDYYIENTTEIESEIKDNKTITLKPLVKNTIQNIKCDKVVRIKAPVKIKDQDDNPYMTIYEDIEVPMKRKQNNYYIMFLNNMYIVNNTENNFTYPEETAKYVPVLLYHYFTEKDKWFERQPYDMPKEKFAWQLKYLQDNNYYNPSPKELEEFIDGKRELPKNSVMITIDDGAYSVYKYAYPEIKKYNARAVMYIIAGTANWANQENTFFIQRETLEKLKKDKDIYLNSHTYSLHNKEGYKDNKRIDLISKEDGIKDINLSTEVLENTDSFAYPLGAHTDMSKDILRECGYTMAFTNQKGMIKKGSDKFELPRNDIYSRTSMTKFKKILKSKGE